MSNRMRPLAAWMAAAMGFTFTACHGSHGSGGAADPAFPGLVALSVAPADPAIPKGLEVQFVATGTFSDGTTADLTRGVRWSNSDQGIAAFSAEAGAEGRARALSTGTVNVAASVDAIAASTTLTVLDATVVSLDVTPTAPTVLVDTSLRLTATATLTDDTTVDLALVSWSSSDAGTVVVGSDGTVYARALGSATVTATEPITGLSASTLVTVTPVPGVLSYVSLKPGSVVGGSGRVVSGVVALTSPPTLSTTVDLATSEPTVTTLDSAQLVFDSATQLRGFVTSTAAVPQRVKVTITASAGGVAKTATLRVRAAK